MSLLPNSLLEITRSDEHREIVRVLHVDAIKDSVYVMCIDRPKAWPSERSLRELETGIRENQVRHLTADPFAHLLLPEETIPLNHRQRRDQAWTKIESIVTAPKEAAFNPALRGPLVSATIEKNGGTKKHIYRYLRRYWQGGMTRNALLPYFDRCGARGKERIPGTTKRGRPRHLTKRIGALPGINIGRDEAEKLRKGYRFFVQKAPEDGGRSLRGAYNSTLRKFFNVGLERQGAVFVESLPSADQLPTFDQFLYWGRKSEDVKDSLIRRKGERKFNLTMRPVLCDSTLMAFGPGSVVQIDSTKLDITAVSSFDRSRRLKRLTLYLVADTFSHLVTGFYLGLENASFFAAGLALENATVDKVTYCNALGIEIDPEEWPSSGLPEAILADRGELEGHGASNLVNSLGIRVANTSPYRADMKGIVERLFRTMNDLLIHSSPGAIRKPKERGERDSRLDAALTIRELRALLARSIILYNNNRLESYRLQSEMISDGVEPRPATLWNWGILNRSGHLRQISSDVLRANLLPGDKATVTPRGLKFRGVYYECEKAMRENWFVKARASRSWQVNVAFDPRSVDTVFLRLPHGGGLELCRLTAADQRFAGKSWEEVEDYGELQAEARDRSKTTDLQRQVDHQAHAEAIFKNAVAAADAANRGLTKAERLRDVRENGQQERLHDWEQTKEEVETKATSLNGSADESAESKIVPMAEPEYIPPASPLEMLRKQRESQWRDHES